MGYKVIWTDEAIADLRQIVIRIAKDNPPAAVKMGEEIIRKSLVLLAEHPRMGQMLHQSKQDTLRQIIIRPYRLIYEIDDAASTLKVRVLWHGALQEPEIK